MRETFAKKIKCAIIHALTASAFSAIVCYCYAAFYFNLIVDFSEGASMWSLIGRLFVLSGLLTLPISICYQLVIHFFPKKNRLGEFLLGLIFSGLTIGLVFYVLKMKEPVFKKEDTLLFVDFYKGFLMPMLFFPLLSWFTFKPFFATKK
ncbi:MAG: hypothetical protein K9I37_00790 [Crocinitomicaceae bacterium]|nr:hypothetical protein [Crocinitomicaceae bacterium]